MIFAQFGVGPLLMLAMILCTIDVQKHMFILACVVYYRTTAVEVVLTTILAAHKLGRC
jgi:hypothetical protein